MSVADICEMGVGRGTPVAPEWPAGDATPGWRETEWRTVDGEDRGLVCGAWEGDPGALRIDPWPYDEICVMLTGRVALVDHDGGRREFGPGSAFVVPAGFRGTWETIEPSSKLFVAVTPPAP